MHNKKIVAMISILLISVFVLGCIGNEEKPIPVQTPVPQVTEKVTPVETQAPQVTEEVTPVVTQTVTSGNQTSNGTVGSNETNTTTGNNTTT